VCWGLEQARSLRKRTITRPTRLHSRVALQYPSLRIGWRDGLLGTRNFYREMGIWTKE
jgi:hypothetical protein